MGRRRPRRASFRQRIRRRQPGAIGLLTSIAARVITLTLALFQLGIACVLLFVGTELGLTFWGTSATIASAIAGSAGVWFIWIAAARGREDARQSLLYGLLESLVLGAVEALFD